MSIEQERLTKKLWDAALCGDVAALAQCLADGADVNACRENGESPLHMAAHNGNIEGVKLLLAARPAPKMNAQDNRGATPLNISARSPYDPGEVATALIEAGADFTIKNIYGMTALHDAARFRNVNVLKAILAKGADVNLGADEGMQTPLHIAANYSQTNTTITLLEAGADIHAKRQESRTALFDAAQWGNTTILDILLAASAPVTEEIIQGTLSRGHYRNAEYLQSIMNGTTPRPTPEQVGLDMAKRNAALGIAKKPILGKHTSAAEHQRQAALDDPEQGI